MRVTATTLRGTGVEEVSKTASVVPDNLELRRYPKSQVLLVDRAAEIGVTEICAMVEFLRARGVKIELVEKERRALAQDIIKQMAKRGWLSTAGLAATEKLRRPKSLDANSMIASQVPVSA